VYDFAENRKRDGPAQFLAGYARYLRADAFSGYDGIYTASDGRTVEVACWAHARRNFFDGLSRSPAEASLILKIIIRFHDIEDRARPLPARTALRVAEETGAQGRGDLAGGAWSGEDLFASDSTIFTMGSDVAGKRTTMSPDGRRVAVNVDGRVRVFDALTRRMIAHLPPSDEDATCLDSSPHGASLATGQADGRILLYRLRETTAPVSHR
jgi:WD40 repeat protein